MGKKEPAKKRVKKYKPRKDEETECYYLVRVTTHAHRPEQIDRLNKLFRREVHNFDSTARVWRWPFVPDNIEYEDGGISKGASELELVYDPKEKL